MIIISKDYGRKERKEVVKVKGILYTFLFRLPIPFFFDICNSITGVEDVDFRLKQIMMYQCFVLHPHEQKEMMMKYDIKPHNHNKSYTVIHKK